MALSNWATLAFDEAGQPCRGTLTGFDGATIEIYKNWLDVRDHKMWTSGRFFEKPTVAQITDGHVILSEFQIEAIQHPEQEAIFTFVQCRRSSAVRWMGGIGCSGFTDPTIVMAEAVGLKLDDWDSVLRGTEVDASGAQQHVLRCYAGDTEETFVVPWSEPQWIGVTAELRAAFFAWLHTLSSLFTDAPTAEWLLRCREHGGLQFNQGDMYLANHGLGRPAEMMTPVGSPRPPTFMQLLKDNNEGER